MPTKESSTKLRTIVEIVLLTLLFFVYAGDMAPMVNEAHYLVKAKNFWDAAWCQNDLFTASGKAHTTFYFLFGWPTKFLSLSATAWIGRVAGWLLLAFGLQRLTARVIPGEFASMVVAIIWIAGVEHGNLAGEWVVGGIEAKVPAYGFVLLALSEMVDRRWNRVWQLLGIASAFHVLSGGWSVIAASLAWLMTEHKRPDGKAFFTPALFVGGAIALFGLVPAFYLTIGVPREDTVAAAEIYSYFRIKHHLLPADFQIWWFVRHGILIALTVMLYTLTLKSASAIPDSQRQQLRLLLWFTMGAVLIAFAGLVVGSLPAYAPELAAKLLRYYWFRLTDAIVPLMLAILAASAVYRQPIFFCKPADSASTDAASAIKSPTNGASKNGPPITPKPSHWGNTGSWLVLLASATFFAMSTIKRSHLGIPPSASHKLLGWAPDATVQQQRAGFADWLAVCDWVRESTAKDEVLLTPRHQQSFKWYAERAEIVNWKDVPQDAESLLEWDHRFADVFPRRLGRVRVTIKYADLKRYRDKYGVRFMVVDRRITGPNLPLVQLYPVGKEINATYAVYELPHADR
ncbi:DUF6798 domain-containing protein [Stieleria marina]|uniref:DUF6798 domain-containing protein n=1 Tax=Stieleria marina TaxID=1930275 RepID=A0A517P191_9BACT|nr:hypothetical protein K239x_51590 [Planctomycetes bacterium K23_9]